MVAGEIVAIGPPASLAGRDEQPTEIRFALPAGVVARRPAAPARRRRSSEDHDGVLITTRARRRRDPHAHRLGARARICRSRGLSLTQPTLEDVYLALTTGEPEEPCDDDPRVPIRRDLALTAWQVRYAQRAFWRNRARRSSSSPSR